MVPSRPVRRALDGVSPWDLESVQRYAIHRASEEVLRTARVTPRLVLVCRDHLEDLDLTSAEGDPVGTFFAVSAREDVEHRILCGSAHDGDGQVAWVFGAANDDEKRFWFATRSFATLPGNLGSPGTTWELSWGVDLTGPMPPMAWLRRDGGPIVLLPAAPPPMPKIGARVDEIPPDAVAPADPFAATNAVSEMGYETKLLKEPFVGVLVFVFRGRTLERWHVIGEIPMGLDDLVRAACAKGEAPSAVVVLRIDYFEHEGRVHRAVKMTAEAGGQRWERLLAMLFSEGDTDSPSNAQFFGSQPQAVGSDGWIGVPPITDLDLFTLGPEA